MVCNIRQRISDVGGPDAAEAATQKDLETIYNAAKEILQRSRYLNPADKDSHTAVERAMKDYYKKAGEGENLIEKLIRSYVASGLGSAPPILTGPPRRKRILQAIEEDEEKRLEEERMTERESA